jgi:COMPASS component SWD3
MLRWEHTQQRVRTLEGHAAPVHALVVSPDGEFLFSGAGDKTVKQWRLRGGVVGARRCEKSED